MRDALIPAVLNVLLWEEEARDNDLLGVLADATASPGLIECCRPRRALVGGGSTFLRTQADSRKCKTLRCGE